MTDKFITAAEARAMPGYPKVQDTCNRCHGTGEIDVSYHGSAEWENCPCNNKPVLREMTTGERDRYTLAIAMGVAPHPREGMLYAIAQAKAGLYGLVFNMWHGPNPSLEAMLAETGREDSNGISCIIELDGDKRYIKYNWNLLLEEWRQV